MLDALPFGADAETARARRAEVLANIAGLLDGETDDIAIYATVACELHHAFAAWHWTGFYRIVNGPAGDGLVIGPYQGGHGCLRIALGEGVCGAAASRRETLVVPDVHAFPGHIACSSATSSEIVVPVFSPRGALLAVLDVDSDHPDAFDDADRVFLEQVASLVGRAITGQ